MNLFSHLFLTREKKRLDDLLLLIFLELKFAEKFCLGFDVDYLHDGKKNLVLKGTFTKLKFQDEELLFYEKKIKRAKNFA